MELLKFITCDKPRRARQAAAAARFFDDDARNLYGAYLRNIKRKYAPHVPEAYLMVAREISRVRAKKIPQMREWRCAPRVRNYVPYVSEPPSRVKRNIRLTMEVRERFADRTTFCRRSAAMSRAEGKSKKTMQSGGTPRTLLS